MFNKNSFSLTNDDALAIGQLAPGASASVSLKLKLDPEKLGMAQPLNKVDVAIKTSAGVSYFSFMAAYGNRRLALFRTISHGVLCQLCTSSAPRPPHAPFAKLHASLHHPHARRGGGLCVGAHGHRMC